MVVVQMSMTPTFDMNKWLKMAETQVVGNSTLFYRITKDNSTKATTLLHQKQKGFTSAE